jgi:2-isopropylmalate synthase
VRGRRPGPERVEVTEGLPQHSLIAGFVLLESQDGAREWSTIGVHPNIIEASWEALVDSIEYGLIHNEGEQG